MKRLQKMAAAAMLLMAAGALPAGTWAQESGTEAVEEAATEAASEAEKQGQVASAEEMIAVDEVEEDWMVPIYGEELQDGTYEVKVASSSAMFQIENAALTVADGKMTAVLTMGGKGYLKLYMGTAQEAAEGAEEDMIPFVENEEGRHTFQVPVEALDEGIDCAAFSKKKEKWYGRKILFQSTSLPMEAFKERKLTTAEDLGLEDGTYLADAALAGGSGRAGIDSPAELTVENGAAVLKVVFSSPNYDYMLVNGEKYEPVNTEGNSTFLIPLAGFDYNMPVTADTVAMGTPHEIDYTIRVDSASVAAAE
ncbi:MAG: hypothetical protein Q4E91_06635 [Lachnospiraceae bacterium]|nr:hypothetical protein [Lachnospiraceae bacterium]